MPPFRNSSLTAIALLMLAGGAMSAAAQNINNKTQQLPAELQGAKIYHLSEKSNSGEGLENLVTYKRIAYQDINFDRLLLNVYLSIQPVDREATVQKIYFQNVKVGGFPVQLAAFAAPFKISKKQAVDLPGPIQCSIVYSDLDSVAPLRQLVGQDKIRITGESFIEVKLNTLQKIFLRTKNLVIPVKFNEEVPLQMFADSPLLKLAATKVLDALSDPTTSAAVSIAQEHVAKLEREHALSSIARQSVYLLFCQYALRNPQSGASEQFTQSGSGFVVSPDGKLVTAKRVIQPWKFDPQIAYLINRYHLELDPKSYRLVAWPAEATLRTPGGQLDFQKAFDQQAQSLEILKTSADHFEKTSYRDPDSGESASVEVEPAGEDDWAVLKLRGNNFQPLALAAAPGANASATLIAYPYGLSQAIAEPKLVEVTMSPQGALLELGRKLEPGESGAPLVNSEGKVLGLASGADQGIPVELFRSQIP